MSLAYRSVEAATVRAARWLAVLILALGVGCSGSESTGPAPDTAPPFVTQWSPQSGATDVPVTTTAQVTFSEPVRSGSLTSATFTLVGPSGPLAGNISVSGTTATFTPSAALAGGTAYTARVAGAVQDTAGNVMGGEFTWTFTTVETTPPAVTSTSPSSGEADVDPGATVSVEFSEPVDPESVTASTFVVSRPDPAQGSGAAGVAVDVAGSRSVSGSTVTFTPSSSLQGGVVHTVRLTTGIRDLTGNAMAADHTWSFTTRETTPPSVVSTSPADGATGVSTTADVTATLSEPVDPATVNAATFTLTGPSGPVSGQVSLSGSVARFDPAGTLATATTYTARLGTGVRDMAGNALASQHVWVFTTAQPAPPTVSSTNPSAGATGIVVGTVVTASFSRTLNAATVNSGTFTLTGPAGAVAGTASSSGATATFDPSGPLAYATTYTARLTTGIFSTDGIALAADHVWSFTTASPPALSVVGRTPAPGAEGVPVGTNVEATFSQTLQASSVDGSTFTLVGPSGPVAATVGAAGSVATLDPTGSLEAGEEYTARLTTGVSSQAGAALGQDVVWSFVTQAPSPVSIVSMSPSSGATGVDADADVSVTLDRPVSDLSSYTLTLEGPDGSVSGTLQASGNVATFDPASPLPGGTTYTAAFDWEITTGSTQSSGGTEWTFTTAPNPLSVVGSSPSAASSGVPIGSTVSATFSASVDPSTVTSSTFQVVGPGGPLSGSRVVSGSTVVFTPDVPLTEFETAYTVIARTGIRDVVGNAMGEEASWGFITVIVDEGYFYRLSNDYLPDQYLDTFSDTKGCYMTTANTGGSYWRFRPSGLGDGSLYMSNDFHGPDFLLEGADGVDRCLLTGPAPPGSVYTGQAWHLVSTAPEGFPDRYRLQNVNFGSARSLDTPLLDGSAFPYMAETGLFSGQFWRFVRGHPVS